LQHSCFLSGEQVREHDNRAAREFKSIMMDVRIVEIDLPKSRNFVIHARLSRWT
jgi:predicted protein tyrosine phosphatase